MHSLHHGTHRPDSSHAHVLGSPRLYDFTVELFFLGRRRANYQTLLSVGVGGVQPGQRVLDVGCGTGYFSRLIARTTGPKGLVVGIDPSASMIEYARHKASSIRNCEFQVGAAEALPFPSDRFDVVVSSLVLHHLPEHLRLPALEEMRRVLRPGGRLLVAEARNPSHGILGLIARAQGYDRMAQEVPDLAALAGAAAFGDVAEGEVRPWLRYVTALKA
jgi:ubiquinone/menaquinone biosynthesis C-methylase UbiE